jgi:DNA/RNA-binding domain of Phe-tRNA-synthetase-like protein
VWTAVTNSIFRATDEWRAAYPGATAAILAMGGITNPADHPALDEARSQLEVGLRLRFGEMDRPALRTTHPISVYDRYCRRFGQTYHVQHQVESVAMKGKQIPRRAALVEAMFMAELETQVLTGGYDLDLLELPISVDVARAGDSIDLYSGSTKEPPLDDMLMRDGVGIITTVILGPDNWTQIRPETTNALFAVYAPKGVGENLVRTHFAAIERNVRLFAPAASTIAIEVITAAT